MEKLFRIFLVSVVSVGVVSSIVYASSTIISVQTQSIAQGDVIANGWFQEVNDRLKNIFSSGGNMGINKVSPRTTLEIKLPSLEAGRDLTINGERPGIEIHRDNTNSIVHQHPAIGIYSHSDVHADAHIMGLRSRGTEQNPIAVLQGDYLLSVLGYGKTTGVGYLWGGGLNVRMDGDAGNTDGPTKLELMVNGGAGGYEAMTIRGNGNVGIGTSVPMEKLSVFGTIQSIYGGFKFPDGTVQTTAAVNIGGTNNGGGCVLADTYSNSIGPYMSIQENSEAYRWRSFGYYTWTAFSTKSGVPGSKNPPNGNFYGTDSIVCSNSSYPYKMERTTITCQTINGILTQVEGTKQYFCFNSSFQYQ